MDTLTHTFALNGPRGLGHDVYFATKLAEGLRYGGSDSWALQTVPDELLADCQVLLSSRGDQVVARLADALVRVQVSGRSVGVQVAAATPDAVDAALAELRRRLPEAVEGERPSVKVGFWNWTGDCSRHRPQVVEVPTWDDVRDNYASAITGPLGELMSRDGPPRDGRLVLWHGPPGTGKTHLIRALAYAWRTWCSAHYIVDVDHLLRGNTEYLTSLVLDGGHGEDGWRLLILEDAGEFLLPDAPSTQGQGFSRLLNTLDGMLGQSARVLVLVTTNRPLSALDPAITRPGRCAMTLEVPPLSAGDAAAWLAARGHSAPVGGGATLAELYGVLRGDPPPAARRAVGFVG